MEYLTSISLALSKQVLLPQSSCEKAKKKLMEELVIKSKAI